MIIHDLIKAKYVKRPNRFTVEFKLNDKTNIAHLHDPGRLTELLSVDVEILVKYVPTYKQTNRKTKYDVIAVKYTGEWVLINSSYHNNLVEEILNKKEIKGLEKYNVKKREHTIGNSRIDFLLMNKKESLLYLEVKGCTLVEDNVAKFPDAPTKRGSKHVKELTSLSIAGNLTAIIILILQNKVDYFKPNNKTDPEFSKNLKIAHENNVKIFPTHITTKLVENNLILNYEKIIPFQF